MSERNSDSPHPQLLELTIELEEKEAALGTRPRATLSRLVINCAHSPRCRFCRRWNVRVQLSRASGRRRGAAAQRRRAERPPGGHQGSASAAEGREGDGAHFTRLTFSER